MGLEVGKMLCAKPRVSVNMRVCCHKHAVTILTQPGHVDGQLKERLMSQKEKNRNCLLKIIQSISYHSCKGIAPRKSKQDKESNFKKLLLLRAEDNEVLQK